MLPHQLKEILRETDDGFRVAWNGSYEAGVYWNDSVCRAHYVGHCEVLEMTEEDRTVSGAEGNRKSMDGETHMPLVNPGMPYVVSSWKTVLRGLTLKPFRPATPQGVDGEGLPPRVKRKLVETAEKHGYRHWLKPQERATIFA